MEISNHEEEEELAFAAIVQAAPALAQKVRAQLTLQLPGTISETGTDCLSGGGRDRIRDKNCDIS